MGPESEEEVRHYSSLFNEQMVKLRPREATNGQNFNRLFKHSTEIGVEPTTLINNGDPSVVHEEVVYDPTP